MVAAKQREAAIHKAVLSGELEIDSQGRVWRSAVRRGDRWNKGTTRLIQCARRRAENSTGKYLQVRVMYDNQRIHALAHRLVYHHFFGPIPLGLTVNHKNGIKTDNRPANLELATNSQQQIHAVRVLKTAPAARQSGESNHRAKLTDNQVIEIRRRRSAGETLTSIAADFNVAFQTVSKIARGDRRA